MLSSRRIWGFAVVASLGAMCGVSVADEAPPDLQITAIWHIQQIDFVYNSTTVRYSCGNLQRRIAQILQAVGAHASMGVEIGCNSAVDAGLYTFTFAKTGAKVSGRYTYTYRWNGSQWLITSHHSSAMPEKVTP